MSFFDYSPDPSGNKWTVSLQIWIYFVVAVPMTVLSLWAGQLWQDRVSKKPPKPLIETQSSSIELTEQKSIRSTDESLV